MTVAEFKESGDMWPGGINKKKFFSNIKGRGKGEWGGIEEERINSEQRSFSAEGSIASWGN